MKDIILINPDRLTGSQKTNIGLASIESFLNHNGLTCATIDSSEIGDYIDQAGVFGISVLDHTYIAARDLTEKLRDKTVIWGGRTPTAIPEFVLKENPGIDYVVLQEGEKRLLALLRSFKQPEMFDGIDGIAYRNRQNKIVIRGPERFLDMDELPIPTDRVVFNYLVFIELTRGCYGKCGYCQEVHKMRFKSAKKAGEEIDYWYNKGFRQFYVGNANSIANGRLLLEFIEEIEKRKLSVELSLVGRPDDVLRNYDVLKKIFKSKIVRLFSIEIGIETNVQYILDLLGRGTTTEINRKAINALIDLKKQYSPGTTIQTNIILFSHFDMTIDDFVENARFIGDYGCSRDTLAGQLYGVANTPVWEEMKRRGFKQEKRLGLRIWDYAFTDKDVNRLFRKLFGEPFKEVIGKDKSPLNFIKLLHECHDKVMDFYRSGNIKTAVMDFINDQ